jgi:endoglucanase
MNRIYKPILFCLFIALIVSFNKPEDQAWIRINQLGYTPGGVKVAVWCSKENKTIKTFQLIDAKTKKIAFNSSAG